MSRAISLIILVPLAIVLIVFCVANRAATEISLDPLGTMPQLAFQAPLFVLLLGALLLGVILGGFGHWLSRSSSRRGASRRDAELAKARKEAEDNKAKVRDLQLQRDRAAAGEGQSRGTALAAPGRAA